MTSVCYILSYRDPDYVRTRTLVKSLKEIKSIRLFQARNTSKGFWRYFQTLSKLIVIRITKNPRYYILGFRGYEIFWPVRLITLGKQLIFDHMMSPYDSLLNERKTFIKGSLVEKLTYVYEKSILHSADLILTDTDLHKDYYQELFSIEKDKVMEIPVGADEELFNFYNATPDLHKSKYFEVLFYGSFLPLHRVDIILEAASMLQEYPIHFTLIGGDNNNQYYRSIKLANLANITQVKWVDFEKLPQLIANSNIGLGGPFGNTGQSRRVITGKTLQYLAMGKPIIIGEISKGYGFEDKVNCIIVPRVDGKSLADAIIWSFKHCDRIEQIGRLGFELYKNRYSIKQITQKMERIFDSNNL